MTLDEPFTPEQRRRGLVLLVGYYPRSAWYLYVVAFVAGLVFGWLRKRRGRLVVPGIAHGLVG